MFDVSSFQGAGGFNDTNQASQETPGKGKEVRRLQSVVPVCIRQIRDCEEDEFKLFGMPTQILTLVGIVRDYEVQTTKATYNIEDHTGAIRAIWWLENDSDNSPKLPSIKENTYVQIFGSIRIQDGEKMIMVLQMFSVSDANVITKHLLEVVHTRLEAEAMLRNPVNQTMVKMNNPGAELATSMAYYDENAASSDTHGLTPIQSKIYQFLIASSNNTNGVHKNAIVKKFPEFGEKSIVETLTFLMAEGHAYSTIDSDHYTATCGF